MAKSAEDSRTFKEGLSINTVPEPVNIALALARKNCTSRRAASPVIHMLSPDCIAVRPSKLIASLTRTQGKPCSMRLIKPALSFLASISNKPLAVSMPAALSMASPEPATKGFGSCMAAITRFTPALIKAVAQGGVLPVCEQGSKVT